MLSNTQALKIFEANLRPRETFLAKSEINYINYSKGKSPKRLQKC